MATFRDNTGAEWKLVLTVGIVADVKRDTGVNLALTAKDASWVETLFGDPAGLVKVLYALCEAQCKAATPPLAPEAFAHRFDGPALEAAGDALAEAIADFFPRSRIAQALRGNLKRALTAAEDRAIAVLDRPSGTGSPSPTSAPESSASIPAG